MLPLFKNPKLVLSLLIITLGYLITSSSCSSSLSDSIGIQRIPENKANNINPDTHLKLKFASQPVLGKSGKIRIYDATNDTLVDSLDLSIPPGPTKPDRSYAPYTPVPYEYVSGNFTNANTKPGTPSGAALPTSDTFQLNIIGGFTDAFHFYPVIIHENTATIYLHNNILDYDKTYYVSIDSAVFDLAEGDFQGINRKKEWKFSTKKSPPSENTKMLIVSADGTGDFNTVQGAIDFVPDNNVERITIFIKNGTYEEIVYFRNKSNITIIGEEQEKVEVCYANNEVFNPHPKNIATNEWPGTFPSRRAAFMGDNCTGIHLVNFTIRSINDVPAQAEGLLLMGSENIISNMIIEGSGDALQVNGSVYVTNSQITGLGDNILGRGPGFYYRTKLISTGGPHMWIRNTAANHGNVFLECSFSTIGDKETVIARTSSNKGKGYPDCEAVLLNCVLEGVTPEAWGVRGEETSNIHYWEFNSTNLSDGKPADVSQRHPISRQLKWPDDSTIINNYSNPTYVLGGWTPKMAPILLSKQKSVELKRGQPGKLSIQVAAIPEAVCQWYKDGHIIAGETSTVLNFDSVDTYDAGNYKATIEHNSGRISSLEITVIVADE